MVLAKERSTIRFSLTVRNLSITEANDLLRMCENIGHVDRYRRRRRRSGKISMEVCFYPSVGRTAFDEIKRRGWRYELRVCH